MEVGRRNSRFTAPLGARLVCPPGHPLPGDPGVLAPKHLHVQLKAGGHLQQQSEDVFVEGMWGRGDRFPIWGLGRGWATACLLNPASPPASFSIHHPRWGPQQSSHLGGLYMCGWVRSSRENVLDLNPGEG